MSLCAISGHGSHEVQKGAIQSPWGFTLGPIAMDVNGRFARFEYRSGVDLMGELK